MQTYIYFHICRMNNWKEIVEKLWTDICASGLYEKVTEIRAVAVGATKESPPPFFSDPKFRLLYESDDASNYERSTLNLLYTHSVDAVDDFQALYIHSKGVTHNNKYPGVTDWTNYLSYFNIYKHDFCREQLLSNDAVGVNLTNVPQVHFSGNFWWSKSSHIRTLSVCNDPAYLAPEFWITKKENGVYKSLWESGVNHYNQRYLPDKYVDKI